MASVATAEKLARIIPRLGSNHDGEVIATAKAIERVLRAESLDWHSLANLIANGVTASPRPTRVEAAPSSWMVMTSNERWTWLKVLQSASLTAWEREFVESVSTQFSRRKGLSLKQAGIVDRIIKKVAGA